MPLPTEKTKPADNAKQAKIMLYGPPKIGKSTLAAALHPKTIVAACEPGMGGIEAFVQPIGSWADLRQLGADLAKEKHEFTHLVIDTIDEAYRYCADDIYKKHGIHHASDLTHGKGWAMVADEFRLRIAKLCSLGMAVTFISHAKDVEVEQRVGKITKTVPTMSTQPRTFITGFSDYILFATFDEKEQRILRTQPSEYWDAGQRLPQFPLPDPMELSASDLAEALGIIEAPKTNDKNTNKEKKA